MSKKLRALQAKKSAVAQEKVDLLNSASTLLDKADAEGRDLNDDEGREFARLKANADLKGTEIERLQAAIDLEQERIAAQAAAGSVVVLAGNGQDITLEDRGALDQSAGFRNFGEFARAVFQASLPGNAPDGRLLTQRLAAAPTVYGSETAGADGGFLVPPQFAKDIFTL